MAIRLICRNSPLSLAQVDEIKNLLPTLDFEIMGVTSLGDKLKQIPLESCDIADFFTRELDLALLQGEADIAVHSAKDLPYPLPRGLKVVALTRRADPSDALVTLHNQKLKDLPPNPRIGTSSVSRARSILSLRPDARIVSIRGTIGERIDLIAQGKTEAVVIATCALQRLGWTDRISEILPGETHPLQGHLAIVARSEDEESSQTFAEIDIRKTYGRVTLAGFGPGDPELLTIKAFKALENADAIFFDDLIDQHYLKNFKAKAIYVGKRKGNHSHTQDEINELLYQSAQHGQNTVRLKGGDPFIFGRGGEEFEYLHQRLITPVVIPGITAAMGAAAQAGIPLTNRGESSSVSFNTASALKDIHVPDTDTLVFYMGASNLKALRNQVLNSGKTPETPSVIITNASLPHALAHFTTLSELPDETISPAVIIIGKTVKDRNTIAISTTPAKHHLNTYIP